jgi:hypothetical protein
MLLGFGALPASEPDKRHDVAAFQGLPTYFERVN